MFVFFSRRLELLFSSLCVSGVGFAYLEFQVSSVHPLPAMSFTGEEYQSIDPGIS
jgi:hypothetical protein